MTYSELLRSPKWQKKRLEIFNRDHFTCRNCNDNEKTLEVHHILYQSQIPWETEDKYLITLCSDCHELEESLKTYDFTRDFAQMGITRIQLMRLVEGLRHTLKQIDPMDRESINDLITWLNKDKR